MGVLSETLGLRRPPRKISPMGVPIRYRVLNDEDLTIGGVSCKYTSAKIEQMPHQHIACNCLKVSYQWCRISFTVAKDKHLYKHSVTWPSNQDFHINQYQNISFTFSNNNTDHASKFYFNEYYKKMKNKRWKETKRILSYCLKEVSEKRKGAHLETHISF